MKKFIVFLLLFVFTSILCYTNAFGGWSTLTKINGFNNVQVHVIDTPSLNEEKLNDYAKLKFKNNFGKYNTLDGKHDGFIFITIQTTVSDTSWLAVYYVELELYKVFYLYKKHEDYSVNSLGYCNQTDFTEQIKKSISHLIETAAIDFFKIKGEL